MRTMSHSPYGQEVGTVTANDRVKFGTYTRDAATGLDYAMNRYYQSTWGRFTSPDPYRASGGPGDPGSWNRYSYVQGDPVNYGDTSGLFRHCPGGLVDGVCKSPADFPIEWEPTKIDYGFSLPGGGGGGGRMDYTSTLPGTAEAAIENLSPDCVGQLNKKGVTTSDLKSTALKTKFFDATTADGNLTVAQANGSQWTSTTLSQLLGGARAAVLPDSYNVPSPFVVIGEQFKLNGRPMYGLGLIGAQWVTLVHEILHIHTKLNDVKMAEWLGLGAPPPGLDGSAQISFASQSISAWLSMTCF